VRGWGGRPVSAYMLFCLAVMGGISVWAWRYATVETLGVRGGPAHDVETVMIGAPRVSPAYLRGAMMLAFGMMLLFSPHYPWYIVWLVPFLVLVPSLQLLVYVMGFFYLFTTQLAEPGPKMFLLNEILYGAVVVAFVVQTLGERVWRPAASSQL
jgi:alpha-1,6-mannosyltransferase